MVVYIRKLFGGRKRMKRMGMTAAAVALLFAFLLFCVDALVRYARPMNDASYDLSLAGGRGHTKRLGV